VFSGHDKWEGVSPSFISSSILLNCTPYFTSLVLLRSQHREACALSRLSPLACLASPSRLRLHLHSLPHSNTAPTHCETSVGISTFDLQTEHPRLRPTPHKLYGHKSLTKISNVHVSPTPQHLDPTKSDQQIKNKQI